MKRFFSAYLIFMFSFLSKAQMKWYAIKSNGDTIQFSADDITKHKQKCVDGIHFSLIGDSTLVFWAERKSCKFHGVYRVYYYNGKMEVEGSHKKGKNAGVWKKYFENGNLKSEEVYKNGLLNGKSL